MSSDVCVPLEILFSSGRKVKIASSQQKRLLNLMETAVCQKQGLTDDASKYSVYGVSEGDILEAELQLKLNPAACSCCCNIKYDEFVRRLSLRFRDEKIASHPKTVDEAYGLKLWRPLEYVETAPCVKDGPRSSKRTRIYMEASSVSYDTKLTLSDTIVAVPDTQHVALLVVSTETCRKRLVEATADELSHVRSVLSFGKRYCQAINRFYHPADRRLSITYKENAKRDESYVTIEYEITDNLQQPLQFKLVDEFTRLFPHNWWGPHSQPERQRDAYNFDHAWRPRVYTLCPELGKLECASVFPQRSLRDWLACFPDLEQSALKKLSGCKKFAVKWDGVQHIMFFEYIAENAYCTLNIMSANNSQGFCWRVPVVYNKQNFDESKSATRLCLTGLEAYTLRAYFFVVEMLKPTRTRSERECIVVDVTNAQLSKRSLRERLLILEHLLNETVLRKISEVATCAFRLQRWYNNLVEACEAVRREIQLDRTDGLLGYDEDVDVVYKAKNRHTVDLVSSESGVLHTEDGVVVSRPHASVDTHSRVSEFSIIVAGDTLKLAFVRERSDRITGNSFAEFCDAVKASLANPLGDD